jgi:hypothetical protein
LQAARALPIELPRGDAQLGGDPLARFAFHLIARQDRRLSRPARRPAQGLRLGFDLRKTVVRDALHEDKVIVAQRLVRLDRPPLRADDSGGGAAAQRQRVVQVPEELGNGSRCEQSDDLTPNHTRPGGRLAIKYRSIIG